MILISGLAVLLLAWYDQNARDLPWRRDPTPYRVWVSEMMLMQTRVETVIPYFERFIAALPDVRALGNADESAVLKLWEGLGYYSRARNLQKAAQMVVERYGGALPCDRAELRKLPGIGDYASGAIASIAFGRLEEAVDGNVLRVLSRVYFIREDIGNPAVKNRFRELARALVPTDRPGDFNQALMDLGATVCLPGAAPRCDACPLVPCCSGLQEGAQGELPVQSAKKPRALQEITVLIVQCRGRALLMQRPKKGLLAGLWGPPMTERWIGEKDASDWLVDQGAAVRSIRKLEDAKHVFTHVEWHMQAWLAETDEFLPEGEHVWADQYDISKYAIPSAFKAYKKYLVL
jgi:A/G-specific adenine glycosylase